MLSHLWCIWAQLLVQIDWINHDDQSTKNYHFDISSKVLISLRKRQNSLCLFCEWTKVAWSTELSKHSFYVSAKCFLNNITKSYCVDIWIRNHTLPSVKNQVYENDRGKYWFLMPPSVVRDWCMIQQSYSYRIYWIKLETGVYL